MVVTPPVVVRFNVMVSWVAPGMSTEDELAGSAAVPPVRPVMSGQLSTVAALAVRIEPAVGVTVEAGA